MSNSSEFYLLEEMKEITAKIIIMPRHTYITFSMIESSIVLSNNVIIKVSNIKDKEK